MYQYSHKGYLVLRDFILYSPRHILPIAKALIQYCFVKVAFILLQEEKFHLSILPIVWRGHWSHLSIYASRWIRDSYCHLWQEALTSLNEQHIHKFLHASMLLWLSLMDENNVNGEEYLQATPAHLLSASFISASLITMTAFTWEEN